MIVVFWNLILFPAEKWECINLVFSSLDWENLDKIILNCLLLSCVLKAFVFRYCPIFIIFTGIVFIITLWWSMMNYYELWWSTEIACRIEGTFSRCNMYALCRKQSHHGSLMIFHIFLFTLHFKIYIFLDRVTCVDHKTLEWMNLWHLSETT